VTLYGADGESKPLTLPEQDGFEAELQYFTDCCMADRHPDQCPPEESAAAVRLTQLLLKARKTGGERLVVGA